MHIAILAYLGEYVTPIYEADIEVVLNQKNILPRLLYPWQLVTVVLSNKLIKALIGRLSSCIWSKRNP